MYNSCRSGCAIHGSCRKKWNVSVAADRAAFDQWLSDGDVSGVMSAWFLSMFTRRPAVDCWVSPDDDFALSLAQCLVKFELQGGRVQWAPASEATSVVTAAAPAALAREAMHARSKATGSTCSLARAAPKPRWQRVSRNAQKGSPRSARQLAQAGRMNSSPHLPCGDYFATPRAQNAVSAGFDRALTNAGFGFGGCCGGACEMCGT